MDEEQFSALFEAQFTDVWRFARRRTASGSDADDITAETFTVAWRRRAEVPAGEARLWLFGIARHVLANHWRHGARRDRLHLRLVGTDGPAGSYEQPAPSHEVLWPALAALPEKDRELLLMRAWDGLGVSEIAALLDVDPATVSSRLHKARLKLDRELTTRNDALSLEDRKRYA
jgi:RNA polymerase sigma-70 factor, ECF subfamily